jgi:hypothetical protein
MAVVTYTEILLKIGVIFSQLFLTIYVKEIINIQRGSEQEIKAGHDLRLSQ